jgi:hypothetical protein
MPMPFTLTRELIDDTVSTSASAGDAPRAPRRDPRVEEGSTPSLEETVGTLARPRTDPGLIAPGAEARLSRPTTDPGFSGLQRPKTRPGPFSPTSSLSRPTTNPWAVIPSNKAPSVPVTPSEPSRPMTPLSRPKTHREPIFPMALPQPSRPHPPTRPMFPLAAALGRPATPEQVLPVATRAEREAEAAHPTRKVDRASIEAALARVRAKEEESGDGLDERAVPKLFRRRDPTK